MHRSVPQPASHGTSASYTAIKKHTTRVIRELSHGTHASSASHFQARLEKDAMLSADDQLPLFIGELESAQHIESETHRSVNGRQGISSTHRPLVSSAKVSVKAGPFQLADRNVTKRKADVESPDSSQGSGQKRAKLGYVSQDTEGKGSSLLKTPGRSFGRVMTSLSQSSSVSTLSIIPHIGAQTGTCREECCRPFTGTSTNPFDLDTFTSVVEETKVPQNNYSAPGDRHTQKEDGIVIQLRTMGVSWSEITKEHFPERALHSVESRWSKRLKPFLNDRQDGLLGARENIASRKSSENRLTANERPMGPSSTESREAPRRSSRRASAASYDLASVSHAPNESSSPLLTCKGAVEGAKSLPASSTVQTVRERHGKPWNATFTTAKKSLRLESRDLALDTSRETSESSANTAGTPLLPCSSRSSTAIGYDPQPVSTKSRQSKRNGMNNEGVPNRPYVPVKHREMLRKSIRGDKWGATLMGSWTRQTIHVDFSGSELTALRNAVKTTLRVSNPSSRDRLHQTFTELLKDVTQAQLHTIVQRLRSDGKLKYRREEDIKSCLEDAAYGALDCVPRRQFLVKGGHSLVHQDRPLQSSAGSLLRQREHGSGWERGWRSSMRGIPIELRNQVHDTLGPLLSFTGTSSDVGAVAWAPHGNMFAAGSYATTDRDSMQYNRPNNLLLGDLRHKTLQELPEHHVKRQRQDKGVNAMATMHQSQDPRLFTTVTMVAFSPDGDLMYSAGYDKTVRAFDVRSDIHHATCTMEAIHKGSVDLIAVSNDGVLATGCQRVDKNSIKVLRCSTSEFEKLCSFSSQKAADRPETKTYPSGLKWGVQSFFKDWLLAGFSSHSTNEERATYGETCVWDVETQQQILVTPNSRNVFDVAWNPSPGSASSSFAVGSVAGSGVNRGTRSVVRLYNPRSTRFGTTCEFECPALDMNDVVWCPHDDNLIAASCTDGKTYIWDARRPDDILHTFAHSTPLLEHWEDQPREVADTGVQFAAWGDNRTRFYTGSSDGVVKAWNPYLAAEDAHVRDVVTLNSGVMSGAFSPDFCSLLVGEVNGSINVLSVGQGDKGIKDARPFTLKALPVDIAGQPETTGALDPTSGTAIANDLIETGQIVLRSLGSLPIRQAVQGPRYNGPLDRSDEAPALRAKASIFQRNELIKSESNAGATPCALPHSDSKPKFTEEETGDSGRSRDRIPGVLRSAHLTGARANQSAGRLLDTGLSRYCTQCGQPARPRIGEEDETDTNEVLCERCSFSCFRCSGTASITAATGRVVCSACKLTWTADTLGYELLERESQTVVDPF
ncbi:hypothetical protein LTR60_001259, partial [Cryomyces antarcticus]